MQRNTVETEVLKLLEKYYTVVLCDEDTVVPDNTYFSVYNFGFKRIVVSRDAKLRELLIQAPLKTVISLAEAFSPPIFRTQKGTKFYGVQDKLIVYIKDINYEVMEDVELLRVTLAIGNSSY